MKEVKKIISLIKDSVLFQQAFTHSSFKNEVKSEVVVDYENLEFLGDSILEFQVSLFIYQNFPHFSEGQMSKLKQLMVQEKTLSYLSKKFELFEFLILGTGEEKNNGRNKESILADVFESFIAALYLEKGEKLVQKFLKLTLFEWIEGKEEQIWDYKTQLQEYCQAKHNKLTYRVIKEKSENKAQQFIVEVFDEAGEISAKGQGKNKKSAEQQAARNALKKISL